MGHHNNKSVYVVLPQQKFSQLAVAQQYYRVIPLYLLNSRRQNTDTENTQTEQQPSWISPSFFIKFLTESTLIGKSWYDLLTLTFVSSGRN